MLTELLAAARQSNTRLSHQIAEIEKQRLQDSRDAQERQEDLLDQVADLRRRLHQALDEVADEETRSALQVEASARGMTDDKNQQQLIRDNHILQVKLQAQQQRLLAVEKASRAHVSGINKRLEEKDMELDSLQQRLSERSQYAGMLRRLHLDESQRAGMLEAQIKSQTAECSRLEKRVLELEPELQSAKNQLNLEIREARVRLEEAERASHTSSTRAQESQELLQLDLDKMNKKLSARDAKIEDWSEQLAREEDLTELKSSNSKYMDVVAKAKFERQEAFEQREAAQRITNHLQGINDRHVAAVKALALAQAGQKALQEQAKARQEAFEQLQDKLVQALQEASKTKEDLAAASAQIPLLRQEIKLLSGQVTSLHSNAQELQTALDNTQQLLGTCTMELEESQEKANQLLNRLEVATHSYEKLQSAKSRLQEELQEKVKELKELKPTLRKEQETSVLLKEVNVAGQYQSLRQGLKRCQQQLSDSRSITAPELETSDASFYSRLSDAVDHQLCRAKREATRIALEAQEQINAMDVNLDQARAMMATRINNNKLLAQLQDEKNTREEKVAEDVARMLNKMNQAQQEAKQAKGEAAFAKKMVADISKRLAEAEHFVRQARRVQMSSTLRDLLNPDEPPSWMQDMPLPVLVNAGIQVNIVDSHDSLEAGSSHAAQQEHSRRFGRVGGKNAGQALTPPATVASAAPVSGARVKFAESANSKQRQSSAGAPAGSSSGAIKGFPDDSPYSSYQPSAAQSRSSSRQISRYPSRVCQSTDQSSLQDESGTVMASTDAARYQLAHAQQQATGSPAEMLHGQHDPLLTKQVAERCATAPAAVNFLQESCGSSSNSERRPANRAAAIIIPSRIAGGTASTANAAIPALAEQEPADEFTDSAAILQALKSVAALRRPASSAWPRFRHEPSMYIAPVSPYASQERDCDSAAADQVSSPVQLHMTSRASESFAATFANHQLRSSPSRPRTCPPASAHPAAAASGPVQLQADVLMVGESSRPASRPDTSGSYRPSTADRALRIGPSRAHRPITPETVPSPDIPSWYDEESHSNFGRAKATIAMPQTADKFQPQPALQKAFRPTSRAKQASSQQSHGPQGSIAVSTFKAAA
ncbi:hypothetical protein WJX74_001339 [Apatococcus lobatus]|uniref:Uncharacterized protein n=1 Tax=Apatococcus lobatus TaxID=904363 RepID=A0AAW1RY79_9CHLO